MVDYERGNQGIKSYLSPKSGAEILEILVTV